MEKRRRYKTVTGKLIEQLIDDKKAKAKMSTIKGNLCLTAQLRQFIGGNFEKQPIDEALCRDFAAFLLEKLKPSTVREYLQQLAAILAEAERNGIIAKSPMPEITPLLPEREMAERVYLTKEELTQLSAAPCPHESTRQAFLFSCYTGLVLADIETLQWDNIHHSGTGLVLVKKQVKSGIEVKVPLCKMAENILKTQETEYNGLPVGQQDGKVFHLLGRATLSIDLNTWAETAQLNKHITFLVGRHTFATLAITAGVDLYEVSKWCGHASVQATQVYARMLQKQHNSSIHAFDNMFA